MSEILTETISSPFQIHGVTKTPAKHAPKLGEHNQEVLQELGFGSNQIDSFVTSGVLGRQKEAAGGAR